MNEQHSHMYYRIGPVENGEILYRCVCGKEKYRNPHDDDFINGRA